MQLLTMSSISSKYSTCLTVYVCSNFRMMKFTKIICGPVLQKIFSKIGGNHFKRYITHANYEFIYSKYSVFEIFANKGFQKLLHIRH